MRRAINHTAEKPSSVKGGTWPGIRRSSLATVDAVGQLRLPGPSSIRRFLSAFAHPGLLHRRRIHSGARGNSRPIGGPCRQRPQRGIQPSPIRCQAIAALGMIHKTSSAKFRQPRVEHTWVCIAGFLQGAKGQGFAAQFPQYAQGTTPPKQVQCNHDWAPGLRTPDACSDSWNSHALLSIARLISCYENCS